MLLSDVQTRVTKQFGDTSGAMIDATDIARWATDAQLDIVRRTKWNETTTTLASVAQSGLYVVANAFEIRSVTYNGIVLKMATRQELEARYPTRGVAGYGFATPSMWRRTETGIELFPIPADNLGIIVVTHTIRPTPVVNPSDPFVLPEQYHEDIVRRCLERAYETDGQWQAADRMKADVKERTMDAAHDKATGGGDSYPAVRALPGDLGNY